MFGQTAGTVEEMSVTSVIYWDMYYDSDWRQLLDMLHSMRPARKISGRPLKQIEVTMAQRQQTNCQSRLAGDNGRSDIGHVSGYFGVSLWWLDPDGLVLNAGRKDADDRAWAGARDGDD